MPTTRRASVDQITNDLVALHSSDPATVFLSAAVRLQTPPADAIETVEQALYQQRSIVRHHAMRRTLWVMTPLVARRAHAAATAKIARAERKRTVAAMRTSTDIADPDGWLDEATAQVLALLEAEGPLTTRAIGQALPHLAVPIIFGVRTKHPASISAHTKVMQGAGFDAIIVRTAPTGSWNSAEYVWAPTKSWVSSAIAVSDDDEQVAASELLEHWLERFGPATETDIKWWFGWTSGLTRKALAAIDAVPMSLERGQVGYVRSDDDGSAADPGPWVRLLPGLDPTMMGWKERDWYVDPALVPRLFDRFGNAGPGVWVDGEMVGGWIQRPDGEITTELAVTLSKPHRRLLDEAIEELQNVLDDVIVRPRFPAPVQKQLFDS